MAIPLQKAKNITLTIWHKFKEYFHRFISWYKSLYHGRKWYFKTGVVFITLIVSFILYLFAVNINFLWLFGKSPSIKSIMHPHNNEASLVYSCDGKLLSKFFNENRTPCEYEEISPYFFKALISTEDERFYSHFGIDFQGMAAAAKDALKGKARGASTITQQLVKNMFRTRTQYSTGLLGHIPGVKMIIMKSKEWILAIEIELFYSKEEILTMYANTVDFGSNASGINTAAKTYFNTTPSELTIEEAATLVGLLRATSYYNPKLNPENSRQRRNVVLNNMVEHKFITKELYDSLHQLPIKLNYNVETVYDGKALYFRQAVANYLKEWCTENDIDLYTDGLKIYTTIDSRMQEYAEEAVRKQMSEVQKNFNYYWGTQEPWRDEQNRVLPDFINSVAKKTSLYKQLVARFGENSDSIDYYMNLPHQVELFSYSGPVKMEMSTIDSIKYMLRFMHTGFVAVEPQTGFVKAWVGDIDYKSWNYDKVSSKRQPGSTFKTIVYTAAMNAGKSPRDTEVDSYIALESTDQEGNPTIWSPRNADGVYTGVEMPLRAAFARSINTVAVKVGMEVGLDNVVKTAHALGITSNLDKTPSLCLGASDVSLLEMVNAYATIVNDGKRIPPVLVEKVLDRNDKIIYENKKAPRKAIPYRSAFLMQRMLMAGLTENNGTSLGLWRFIRPFSTDTDFGGKTGTSSNYSDAWYIGVTPGLVVGSWVGGEYRCIHFRSSALGQGSRTALPICGYFLQSVLNNPAFSKYRIKFNDPQENIDPSLYNFPNFYYEFPDSETIEAMNDSIRFTSNTPIAIPASVSDPMENNPAPQIREISLPEKLEIPEIPAPTKKKKRH